MENNVLIAAVLIVLIVTVGSYLIVDKIYQPKESNVPQQPTSVPIEPPTSLQQPITTVPTIPWKNVDISGYTKYENHTYNFRIQYPQNANPVYSYLNTDGFETFYFGDIILFVWKPREPNDIQNTLFQYRQFAWVNIQQSNMNPNSPPQDFAFSQDTINVDGVPATRVIFPKLNVIHLGIQTNNWCYWIQYRTNNQTDITTINSFEFIHTPEIPSSITITPIVTVASNTAKNYDLSGNCVDLARKSNDAAQNCDVYGRNDPHCDWDYVTALSDKMREKKCGQKDAQGNIIL